MSQKPQVNVRAGESTLLSVWIVPGEELGGGDGRLTWDKDRIGKIKQTQYMLYSGTHISVSPDPNQTSCLMGRSSTVTEHLSPLR